MWPKRVVEPVIEYVECKVYKPMPPDVVKVEVEKIVERWAVRPAGFFGSLGDRIDGLLRREGM